MVRRHEALRTTFAAVDGRPVQVIAASLEVPLPIVGLSHLAGPDRRATAEAKADEESRRPFDLAAGPLFRATLFRLAEGDHAILLAMHHIITDGWSYGVAAAELVELYGAFRRREPIASARACDPVCRLRDMAARLAPGRSEGGARRLLA